MGKREREEEEKGEDGSQPAKKALSPCDQALSLLKHFRQGGNDLTAELALDAAHKLARGPEEERGYCCVRRALWELLHRVSNLPKPRMKKLLDGMRTALEHGGGQGRLEAAAYLVAETLCPWANDLSAPELSRVLGLCRDYCLDVSPPLRCELRWQLAGRCCARRKHEHLWTAEHMEALLEDLSPGEDSEFFVSLLDGRDAVAHSSIFRGILERMHEARKPLLQADDKLWAVYDDIFRRAGYTKPGGEPRELFAFVLETDDGGFSISKKAWAFINERRVERGQAPLDRHPSLPHDRLGDGEPSANSHELQRSDPDLVEAVRHLGARGAAGRFGCLKIMWAPVDARDAMRITRERFREGVGFVPPEAYFDFEEEVKEGRPETRSPSCSPSVSPSPPPSFSSSPSREPSDTECSP